MKSFTLSGEGGGGGLQKVSDLRFFLLFFFLAHPPFNIINDRSLIKSPGHLMTDLFFFFLSFCKKDDYTFTA